MELYPLKFTPIFKYRIWGGSKLKTALNKEYTEENIGESNISTLVLKATDNVKIIEVYF